MVIHIGMSLSSGSTSEHRDEQKDAADSAKKKTDKQEHVKKVVFITGATRGIGAACARVLAKQGYALALVYRQSHDKALALQQELEFLGAETSCIAADISDEQQINAAFDQCESELGPVTHLVNNAGILAKQMPLVEMSLERVKRIFDVNVFATFLCCREYLRRRQLQKNIANAAIVNVSSVAASLGSPFEYIDYAASKGALDTMTIGLAKEVAELGVRVNAVRPGIIDTSMHADSGEPDRIKRISPSVPMKRGGRVEEVADVVAWLLSEQASYVTGSLIDVSGGR
ncbi:SDR family oxidoreductase [Agaribacterium haliotis]|uniref:SDR family oxidoreductase n=1 Tax=Agaribacterium haliotis TaxID=2013869 RepID=UPI001EFCF071|nr:SDR family oxidoreductase [Agaribacterium haliotis]